MRTLGVRRCAFELVRLASGAKTLVLLALAAALISGCATSEFDTVKSEPGANVNLTLSSTALNHSPTTITVTIDDALVATQPLAKLVQRPKHYRLKLTPGHHELIARANTGRTKEIFPVFVHEHTEWMTLSYQCACEGPNHDGDSGHFLMEQSEDSLDKARAPQ
jgi:hypothetical protein